MEGGRGGGFGFRLGWRGGWEEGLGMLCCVRLSDGYEGNVYTNLRYGMDDLEMRSLDVRHVSHDRKVTKEAHELISRICLPSKAQSMNCLISI